MLSYEQVEYVIDNFGISSLFKPVPEHLKIALVDPVRGYFTIMYYRPVKKGERVSASPPTRCVRGKPAMGCPYISAVILQFVKLSDIFRKANTLKSTHVHAA